MPIWNIASVEDEPDLTICSWRIFEATYEDPSRQATRHFVGSRVDRSSSRVSTAIHSFDLASLRGVTKSGRTYQLQGGPGADRDAEYVWQAWASLNEVLAWREVTWLVFGLEAAPEINH